MNPELAFHPVSWSLPSWDSAGILGLDRGPGTWQESWDLAGILGLDRDPGTCRNPGTWQVSWDWTGICLRVGLEKGGAGTSSSMFSLLRRNSSKTIGGSHGSFWLYMLLLYLSDSRYLVTARGYLPRQRSRVTLGVRGLPAPPREHRQGQLRGKVTAFPYMQDHPLGVSQTHSGALQGFCTLHPQTQSHTPRSMRTHTHTHTHMGTHPDIALDRFRISWTETQTHTDTGEHRDTERSLQSFLLGLPHLAQVTACSSCQPGGSTWSAMEWICTR